MLRKHSIFVYVLFASLILGFIPTYAQQTKLGDITIRFCNNVGEDNNPADLTKELLLNTEAWKTEDICVLLWNGGETDVSVSLNFVDWTITNDADQKKACGSESAKSSFWQYVETDETEFIIKAGETIQTNATLTFPDGFAWQVLGCLTTQIKSANTEVLAVENSMFEIETRKASFIEVNISWDVVINLEAVAGTESSTLKNLWRNEKLFIYKDFSDGTYKAKTKLINKSNVDLEVNIKPLMEDILWTLYALEDQTLRIPWGESREVIIPLEKHIPMYKWPLSVYVDVTYVPKTSFTLSEDDKKERSLSLWSSFLIIPWKILWVALLVILLIAWMWKWNKKRSAKMKEFYERQKKESTK